MQRLWTTLDFCSNQCSQMFSQRYSVHFRVSGVEYRVATRCTQTTLIDCCRKRAHSRRPPFSEQTRQDVNENVFVTVVHLRLSALKGKQLEPSAPKSVVHGRTSECTDDEVKGQILTLNLENLHLPGVGLHVDTTTHLSIFHRYGVDLLNTVVHCSNAVACSPDT